MYVHFLIGASLCCTILYAKVHSLLYMYMYTFFIQGTILKCQKTHFVYLEWASIIIMYINITTSCEAVLFADTVAIDDIDSTHIWTINNLCTDPSVISINTCVFAIEVTTKCILWKQKSREMVQIINSSSHGAMKRQKIWCNWAWHGMSFI